MTIYNLGSINADHFYTLPHLPRPGETLAADQFQTGLGGKGANQSVAVSRAGGDVIHIGAVGPDGDWAIKRLARYGVRTDGIVQQDVPTGHAIIYVDAKAENQIVLYPGANRALGDDQLSALRPIGAGDWLILQNETNLQVEAAKMAKAQGAKVAYSCAPFEQQAVQAVMGYTDLLLLNEVEAAQLTTSMEVSVPELPVACVIVTKGAQGATMINNRAELSVPAYKINPVDTTGAGDTFAGFMVAGLSQGMPAPDALSFAVAAASLKTTRKGTADAIPSRHETLEFMKS